MAAQSASILPPQVKDLSGQRFGRWQAIRHIGRTPTTGQYWMCRCDCGTERKVSNRELAKGRSKSCGCYRAEVTGKRFTVHPIGDWTGVDKCLWDTYQAMLQRCRNPKNTSFKNYGARGITVCQSWTSGKGLKSGYECFLADMGPRPARHLSIDRIDNDGNYEPGNCRWATAKEQAQNRRPRKI